MAKLNFKDKWVLITGASSGLGREIALIMAKEEKAHLVVTARRIERLENLKKEIESSGNTRVEILAADLSKLDDVESVFKKAVEIADIYALINNAGISFYNIAKESDIDIFEKIIQVNLLAPMRLSLKFLSYFQKKGAGAIINITSETGLVIVPYQSAYSASKHGIQAFTEGLHMENKERGIAICSFAPGGVITEMITNIGLDKKIELNSPFNMKPHIAARKAVQAFKKKKFLVVPGLLNKSTVFVARLLPRKVVARLAEIIYRPPA
ncbi:MAG: SDR family oxidoreductase [Acidobacteria bacterium]|jgi:hypothetical protein|nr:SDR family oxidoreductase [Acidobacteriota bacterium]